MNNKKHQYKNGLKIKLIKSHLLKKISGKDIIKQNLF